MEPVSALLIGILAGALVALADRKDQANAASIKELQKELQSPQSKISAALIKSIKQLKLSENLKGKLASIVIDEVESYEVANAILSPSPTSALITAICDSLQAASKNTITERNELEAAIKELVTAFSYQVLSSPEIAPLWIDARITILEDIARKSYATINELEKSLSQTIKVIDTRPHSTDANETKQKVSLSRLPSTLPVLVGRDDKLLDITKAWDNKNTKAIGIIGWGGVGKSALVKSWLQNAKQDDYFGAERVFGWSFYSQGSRESSAISSDSFLGAAMQFFDVSMPEQASPWSKIQEVVKAIRKKKTLLVLDGLEPLQFASGGFEGCLRDHAVKILIKELSWEMNGLCIITSRLPVADLKDQEEKSFIHLPLEDLSLESGCLLLKTLGLKGNSEEIAHAVTTYRGHALSLVILSEYVKEFLEGRLSRLKNTSLLTQNIPLAQRAENVLKSYDTMLEHAGFQNERSILRIISLFDRIADKSNLSTLCCEELVPNLNDNLIGLKNAEWQDCLRRLSRWSLIYPLENFDFPCDLDAHPLIKEYFSKQLHFEGPTTWKVGHKRIYDRTRTIVPKLPSTTHEMELLYQAIYHGCKAGIHQQVLDQVYYPRVKRQNEGYSTRKLGMFGSDIAALAQYLGENYISPISGLKDVEPPYLFNEAGVALQALGRLNEAVEPLMLSMQLLVKNAEWKLAAIRSGNITELHIALGNLKDAEPAARAGLDYARRSNDPRQQIVKLTRLANVLRLLDQQNKAIKLFEEALHLESSLAGPGMLYGREGAMYAELLLDKGCYRDVLANMQAILPLSTTTASTLATAHILLCLGQASLALGHTRRAETFISVSCQQFKNTGYGQFAPIYLLASAHLHWRLCLSSEKHGKTHEIGRHIKIVKSLLQEVKALCRRLGAKLYYVDARILDLRIQLRENKPKAARKTIIELKELINETSYNLRMPELVLLSAQHSLLIGHGEKSRKLLDYLGKKLRKRKYGAIAKERSQFSRACNRA